MLSKTIKYIITNIKTRNKKWKIIESYRKVIKT